MNYRLLRTIFLCSLAAVTLGGVMWPHSPVEKKAEKNLSNKVLVASTSVDAHPLQVALSDALAYEAIEFALRGLAQYASVVRPDRLVIIDFSKPSTEERFFVVNPESGELLFKSLVAHGQGSGLVYATDFSNRPNSHQSSLGFFKTAETYTGKHGHSLRLDGLQPGLNHAARDRAVVIHAADYVSQSFIQQNGYLGRSWGCPALPADGYNQVIDQIKEGTLLLIYHPSLNTAVSRS
jgi:hypothetical protein